jgi:hypothetical protein
MHASVLHPAAGRRLTVTLRLRAEQPFEGLKILFEAPPCAELDPAAVRHEGVSLKAGTAATFSIQVVAKSTEPCLIGATVLQIDGPGARVGWTYGVVLNARPTPTPRVTRGHDAQGLPTVEAVTK